MPSSRGMTSPATEAFRGPASTPAVYKKQGRTTGHEELY